MTEPIVSSATGSIVEDVQSQAVASGYIEFFEIELPNSNIGGSNVDKLYFHAGVSTTFADIQWYSLINESDFGSTDSSKYSLISYTPLPMEATGFELRGSGNLPRPTVRMANINQYWNAYLANFDDLVGAKVIRRKTLEKYLSDNPPVEFNRDVYYIERKIKETPTFVEFELVSAFDVEGIKLPRRGIVAARCMWKYKDTDQGGCDWPVDNIPSGQSDPHYVDKDDVKVRKAKDAAELSNPADTYYTYWGRQDIVSGGTLYNAETYAVGDFVEYQRGVGLLNAVVSVTSTSTTATFELASSALADNFEAGDFLLTKNMGNYDFKNVPLKVTSVLGTDVTVAAPSASGAYTTNSGFIQNTRNTLYRCKTAHSISTSDSKEDIIRPNNITYWELGDVCGKRLQSCKCRFGYRPTGEITSNGVTTVDPLFYEGFGALIAPTKAVGSGYTSTPTVTVTGGNPVTTAVVTANVVSQQVTSYTVTDPGSGYQSIPTITVTGGGGVGAQAVARVPDLLSEFESVSLPFGGFPGAVLY